MYRNFHQDTKHTHTHTHTYFDTPTTQLHRTQIQVYSAIVVANTKKKKTKQNKNLKELDHIKARRAQLLPVVVLWNCMPFVPLSISRKKKQIYHWNPGLPVRQRESKRTCGLICQQWGSNPRPLTKTRTWVWRLRPLGHADNWWRAVDSGIRTHALSDQNLNLAP